MSLSPAFIKEARALAFLRKGKFRRNSRAFIAARDWEKLGHGYFGEVWLHKDYPKLVVKISGREGFGAGLGWYHGRVPSLDGWPVFAEYCLANPHPNLPRIMHFERLSLGVSFGIMPRYNRAHAPSIVDKWADYLEGAKGAPQWMWPVVGMANALDMEVDLHSDNVMQDPETGDFIMTDPFSALDAYA